MPPKSDKSTPAKVRPEPPITYELVVPDLKPLGSLLTTNMVDVFVGPKRKTFRLHEDVLCDRSDYFAATFRGEFAEAQSKELYLPDDDGAAFELFVNWLYGGDGAVAPPKSEEEVPAHLALLALAEKILVDHVHNLAADHIRAYYRTSRARVPAPHLAFVFERTRSHLLQRCLAVVAAMQTVRACGNKGLPGDYRELVMRGGEAAAAFAKYLLYSEMVEGGKGTRVEMMLERERSCVFHHHGGGGTGEGKGVGVCRGAVFGRMEEWEGGEGRGREKGGGGK